MPTWILYALLGALFAAVIPIFAKLGLRELDSTVATALRAWVAALSLTLLLAVLGKWRGLPRATPMMVLFILLSGGAGTASWVCGFKALDLGHAGPVAAVDRLSVVFTLGLAALVLGERL